jgi:polysaccharide export outer membrane protein
MSQALIRTLSLIAIFFTFSATAQDKPTQLDYTLGAGDIIRVQVFQNPELTIDTRVSENGSITYPLIESVRIGGLSIGNAERKIGDALRTGGFVRQPQVNIVLLQIRGNQISVLGQVNRPGRFPLETFNTRVTDMLAAAGGTSAIGDDVAILTGYRNGVPFRQKIDIPALYLDDGKEQDTVLAGGDSIFVHRAPVFYIYGEAQRSGSYRIERDMTVMQALAQSGGPTARGSESRLRLHRRMANGQIEKISPEMSDLIQPNDVIYVRESIF